MGDEVVLPKRRKKDLSGYAALIVAVTGLVTVFVHKPPEETARAGYVELSAIVLQMQQEAQESHDEVVALRGYVEGYVRQHEVLETPVPTGSPAPSPQGAHPPTPPPAPKAVRVAAPPSAALPPPIPPSRAVPQPKSVDAL